MRLPLILSLCLATAAQADVPRPDNIYDTLEILQTALVAAGVTTATIDLPNTRILHDPNNPGAAISFPDNLHLGLQRAADDAERQAILDNVIAVEAAMQNNDAPITPDIVFPVIKNAGYSAGVPADVLPRQTAFVGDMVVLYVADYPTHTATISDDNLAEIGVTADTIGALAFENLQGKAADLRVEGLENGLYYLTLDGYYESAFLLDTDLWGQIEDQIGPIVMVVPARDLVLFGPADLPGIVPLLQEIRDDVLADAPYTISERLYAWDNTGWVVVSEE